MTGCESAGTVGFFFFFWGGGGVLPKPLPPFAISNALFTVEVGCERENPSHVVDTIARVVASVFAAVVDLMFVFVCEFGAKVSLSIYSMLLLPSLLVLVVWFV